MRDVFNAGIVLALSAVCAAQDFPANGHIAFERQVKGKRGIWYVRADGKGLKKLVDDAEWPVWRQDGTKIAFNRSVRRRKHTFVMNPDGSQVTKLADLQLIQWIGKDAVLCRNKEGDVYRVGYPKGKRTLVAKKTDFKHIGRKHVLNPGGLTPDGRWLVAHSDLYRDGYKGTNGKFRAWHCALMLDLQHKDKVYFIGSGCEPTTANAGGFIYHVRGNGRDHPSIYRIKIGDATRKSYKPEVEFPDKEYGHEYFPRVSTDGRWITYGATTGCHNHDTCPYQLFLHRVGAVKKQRRQLTSDKVNNRWPHMFVGALKVGASRTETNVKVQRSKSSKD